jgi:hypothetical protein
VFATFFNKSRIFHERINATDLENRQVSKLHKKQIPEPTFIKRRHDI